MTERLRTTLLVAAVLLASLAMGTTTLLGVRALMAGSGTSAQRQATVTRPDTTPNRTPIPAQLMPFPGTVHLLPAHPAKPHRG
jgi:hypothetical protein